MTENLFDLPLPPRIDKLSATRKLTLANNSKLERGIHPATGMRLIGSTASCGQCIHHETREHNCKTFHKCAKHRLGVTHGAGSDIRVSWPACVLWEPKP